MNEKARESAFCGQAEGELQRLRRRVELLEGIEQACLQAERSRDEKRNLLFALIDGMPDAIYFKDLQSRFVFINKALALRFGLAHPREAVGKTDGDFFLEEHAEDAYADEREVIRTGKPLVDKEERETWRNGRVTWVSTTKVPVYDTRGLMIGVFGVSRGITDRKRIEAELQQHRERLEELVRERTAELQASNERLQDEIVERRCAEETLRHERSMAETYLKIADVLFVGLDVRGCITLVNPRACEILGRSRDELIGRNWFDTCIPESDREDMRSMFAALMAGELAPFERHENAVLTRQGELRTVAWHNIFFRDPAGGWSGSMSAGEDVTDRRRMEQALRRSERMDAIGTLAGGVAHNFNNVLSAIRGHALLIAESVIPRTVAHENALKIVDASRHAGGLTHRLMSVARASGAAEEARLQALAPGDAVREAVELLGPTIEPGKVQITVRHPHRMPRVNADPAKFLDILMNVLMNAVEAMPDGGTIAVDAFQQKKLRPARNASGHGKAFVGIRVRDTGEGIDKGQQPLVFEPFYTTKAAQGAFGLGLTVAREMAQTMGGWIDIRSRSGAGTTVRVFLEKAAGAGTEREADEAEPIEGQTILIVDDDIEWLRVMRETLESCGHRVREAQTAGDGVALYRRLGKEIAVSVIDMMMPAGNGDLLLKEILRQDADASVVVTSGFSREFARTHLPLGAWRFLQKPFAGEEFKNTVNGLIRKRMTSTNGTSAHARADQHGKGPGDEGRQH